MNFKIVEEKSNKEAKLLKLNCNKIYSYTNWKPVYNFEETVKNTSSWYVNYYYKKKNILDFQSIKYKFILILLNLKKYHG